MLANVPRFETWVRKLLSTKGGQVFKGIQPQLGVSLDPLAGQVYDQLYLTGALPWGVGFSQTALAANRNRYQIVNPAGSGLLIVITAYVVTATGATEIVFVSGGGIVGANTIVPATMDLRSQSVVSGQAPMPPTLYYDQGAGAIPGNYVGRVRIGANTNANLPWGVVLPPGTQFGHFTDVNITDSMMVTGYVRDLQPSEKSA